MKEQNEYLGVFDIKESDTFRPTLKSRMHLDSPVSKTLTCREDSCSVIERERGRLRIRRLTPKECIRLMGFTNEDYEAMRSIGMTDSAIYHMAGDSIVVTVLISIFSQLMYEDDRHKKVVNEYIRKELL